MTIEEMRKRKREQGYTYEQISEWTGIDFETVQNVFEGMIVSPRYDILQELEKVFETGRSDIVRDPMLTYQVKPQKMQGQYTVADCLSWPEDERIELIDGVIYGMVAPTVIHQLICSELREQFSNFIKRNKGNCISVVSPVDVKLGQDNKTMVQPDVIIVCKKERLREEKGIVAVPPDLVVEVLSPSTRIKDCIVKLKKYASAGVREYWIADPEDKRIIVHDLEHGKTTAIYGFKDKIPVRIFDNKCEVDFAEIYEHIRFLYDED